MPSEKVTPDAKFHRANTTSSMASASTDESVVQNLMAQLDAVDERILPLKLCSFHF